MDRPTEVIDRAMFADVKLLKPRDVTVLVSWIDHVEQLLVKLTTTVKANELTIEIQDKTILHQTKRLEGQAKVIDDKSNHIIDLVLKVAHDIPIGDLVARLERIIKEQHPAIDPGEIANIVINKPFKGVCNEGTLTAPDHHGELHNKHEELG